MEAKQFLNQYREAQASIKNLEEQKTELENAAVSTAIITDGERVQSSQRIDRVANMAVKIADVDRLLIEWKLWALQVMRDISNVILQIGDPGMKEVLHLRYIQCKTWEGIAEEMGLSYRWVHHLADRALLEVNRILVQCFGNSERY